MPRRDPFRDLVDALPDVPVDDDLRPLARLIAQAAHEMAARSGARNPSAPKSLVKRVATRLAHKPEAVRAAVTRLAYDELASSPPTPVVAPVPVDPDFEALTAAAARRGIPVAELLRMLTWPQHRRMFGWPECRDGRRDWWFPIGAEALRRSVLDGEPYHLLPPHCRRVEDVDMERAPAEGAP